MIEWTVLVASLFGMLGAAARTQVVLRENEPTVEHHIGMSLVWAAKASGRALRPRRDGTTRDVTDMKAAGAFLGLVGGFIVFVLSCIALLT